VRRDFELRWKEYTRLAKTVLPVKYYPADNSLAEQRIFGEGKWEGLAVRRGKARPDFESAPPGVHMYICSLYVSSCLQPAPIKRNLGRAPNFSSPTFRMSKGASGISSLASAIPRRPIDVRRSRRIRRATVSPEAGGTRSSCSSPSQSDGHPASSLCPHRTGMEARHASRRIRQDRR